MVAILREDIFTLPIDQVICGDSLEVLKGFPINSIDAICCDPPAGINFMNKPFDDDRGGRDNWIAWLAEIMREALRCLKPGGYGLVWALPRTSHWTAMALEDSGFIVKDAIFHHFGSGFPKSMDISKAIDKMHGAEREVIGRQKAMGNARGKGAAGHYANGIASLTEGHYEIVKDGWDITAPATPEAQQWQGYGTALKPSTEIWWLVQKPISERTIVANVLKWETGGLNVDGCRVGNETRINRGMSSLGVMHDDNWQPREVEHVASGRWPANLLLSHSIWCIPQGVKRVRGDGHKTTEPVQHNRRASYGTQLNPTVDYRYNDADGHEQVEAYECHESCPIRALDEQSGIRKSGGISGKQGYAQYNTGVYGSNRPGSKIQREASEGGASRYFQNFHYFAKASRSERNRGCEGLQASAVPMYGAGLGEGLTPESPVVEKNSHPTVKSLALMRWLIRLITSPGGIVLDCFAGSGSTLVAAIQEGMHFIGIEQSSEYVAICEARIAHAWEVLS